MSEVEASLHNLDRAIRNVQKKTGRSAQNAVLQACIHLCQAGRGGRGGDRKRFFKSKATTRRTLLRGSYNIGSKKATAKSDWLVVVLKQSGPPSYLTIPYKKGGKPSRKKPPIKPENIGLAWRSWGWLLRTLPGSRSGGNLQKPYRRGMNTSKTGYVNKSRYKSVNPTIEIVNKLSYLEEHIPGLSAQLIDSAANKIEKIAEKEWSKVKSSWV